GALAARSVRHHAVGFAVRAGRHDARPGDLRARPLPRRLRNPIHPGPRAGGLRRETTMFETVLKRVRDYGTPARVSEQTVTLTIDGQAITVPAGTSVMRAAAEAGVSIPKLCATDSLEAFGS